MAALQIACPKCGKTLKLPDRSLLGRKGKCGKCGHSFILDEPDEVQLELAEPTASQPPVGTSPRWVPDPAAAMPPGYPAGYPMPPQPMPQQQWPAQMPYWAPPYAPPPYAGQPPMTGYPTSMSPNYGQPVAPAPMMPPFPVPIPAAPEPTLEVNPFAGFGESGPSSLPPVEEMSAGTSRLRAKKKQKAKQLQMTAMVVGILVLVLGGSAVAFRGALFGSSTKANGKTVANVDANSTDEAEEPAWESPLPVSPTKGEPIELFCMPYGVTAVVHFRPAELWAKGSKGEEFRYCWGPLGEWLEKHVQEICKFEPAQIEEVTFGLIPSVVGEPMQVAALVRLKERAQKTDLIRLFKGEYNESGAQYPVYIGDQYAYVIKDLQTFAVAPKLKQAEMAESVNRPNAQAPGLEALLKHTDRQRQLVVMFEPTVLGAHVQFILPQELLPFADRFLEFFNWKHVETVAWSLHLGSEKFHSELLMRNKSSISKTPRVKSRWNEETPVKTGLRNLRH